MCLGKILFIFFKLASRNLILKGTDRTSQGKSVEVRFQVLHLVYVQKQIIAQSSQPCLSLKRRNVGL